MTARAFEIPTLGTALIDYRSDREAANETAAGVCSQELALQRQFRQALPGHAILRIYVESPIEALTRENQPTGGNVLAAPAYPVHVSKSRPFHQTLAPSAAATISDAEMDDVFAMYPMTALSMTLVVLVFHGDLPASSAAEIMSRQARAISWK
jgi:hypothetical protein